MVERQSERPILARRTQLIGLYPVRCELGSIETTEPTGGEYWGGPTNGQAAADSDFIGTRITIAHLNELFNKNS